MGDMLDLNLNFILPHDDDEDMLEKFPGGVEMDESGTSNSSIVNADVSSNAGDGIDDDEDTFPVFNFDILKVNSNNSPTLEEEEEEGRRSEFVTRQLFPLTEESRLARSQHGVLGPNEIDLSFSTHQAIVQQKPAGVPQQPPYLQPQHQGNGNNKKSRRGPRSRSSQYRGVTFYRRTGRWESHIWDCGKQVYLGGFDTAHAAARAYDRAAIKFRGVDADINFHLCDYEEDLNQMKNLSKEEFVHILRRQSTGFSRGSSKYRGVTLHKCGRWEARMGQFLGKKAYDQAAIKCNGREAVTNFEPSTYEGDISLEAQKGSEHNLDLNLGISSPYGDDPRRNNNLEAFQFHNGTADTRRLQMENAATNTVASPPLNGLPVISEYPPSLAGVYPNVFPGYEERAPERKTEAGPSLGPSNWVWRMQGHNPMTLVSSAAASSGFSPPITTAYLSSSGRPSNPNPIVAFNHPFATSPMAATNCNSQYYYQIRPPPPPPPPP